MCADETSSHAHALGVGVCLVFLRKAIPPEARKHKAKWRARMVEWLWVWSTLHEYFQMLVTHRDITKRFGCHYQHRCVQTTDLSQRTAGPPDG